MGACVAVLPGRDEQSLSAFFSYRGAAHLVTLEMFLRDHVRDDLLILNPPFQQAFYSLEARCRIISYVQHYTTFDHRDPGKELFISASHYIAAHIRHQDGIGSVVINPFVPDMGAIQPLAFDRKRARGIANFKGRPASNGAIMAHYAAMRAMERRSSSTLAKNARWP